MAGRAQRGERTPACDECGAPSAGSGRFCGRCGALLDASGPDADGGDGSAPERVAAGRGWRTLVVVALLAVALATVTILNGEVAGPQDDDLVSMPEEVETPPPFPPLAESTDAAGAPRCHDGAVVVDCVEWTAELPGTALVRFAQPLADQQALLFGEPASHALLDVREGAVRWTQQVGDTFAQAVLADERLILAQDEALTGIDVATGGVVWRRDDLADTAGRRPGLQLVRGRSSSAAIVEVADEGGHQVLGIDPSDGTVMWRRQLEADESLLLAGGRLLAVPARAMMLGPNPGPTPPAPVATVRALDLETGETRWRSEGVLVTRSPTADPLGPAEPASSSLALVADDRVRLIDAASGEQLLAVPGIDAAFGRGVLVVRGGPDELAAYDIDDGELRWVSELPDAPTDSRPIISVRGASVAVEHRAGGPLNGLAVFDLATGELRYRFERGEGAAIPLNGETAVHPAANLTDWTIGYGSLAVVHQHGPERLLWLVDLETLELEEARVDGEAGEHVSLTEDLVILFGESGPFFIHRDDLDRRWQLATDQFVLLSMDPLVVGVGGEVHGVTVPPPGT